MLHLYYIATRINLVASEDTFTALVPTQVEEHEDYLDWEEKLEGGAVKKVHAAIEKIEMVGIITGAKSLGDGLFEKKWNSGLRLYFAVVMDGDNKTLLILGSKKGKEQQRAINKAKIILNKYDVFKGNIKTKN